MTGALVLPAPANPGEATNKAYVDAQLALALTPAEVLAGTNITVNRPGDGTVIINSTGGGSADTRGYHRYSAAPPVDLIDSQLWFDSDPYTVSGFALDALSDVDTAGQADGRVLAYDGASSLWKPSVQSGMPRGIVAYKMGPGGTVAISNTVAVEFLRLTNVPLSAGRLYNFIAVLRAFSQTTSGHISVRTPGAGVIAGTTLAFDQLASNVAALSGGCVVTCPFTVTTDGNYTFPVQVIGTGTGTAYIDQNTHLCIEDIGPNRGGQ
jgi:hypothetical protein